MFVTPLRNLNTRFDRELAEQDEEALWTHNYVTMIDIQLFARGNM